MGLLGLRLTVPGWWLVVIPLKKSDSENEPNPVPDAQEAVIQQKRFNLRLTNPTIPDPLLAS